MLFVRLYGIAGKYFLYSHPRWSPDQCFIRWRCCGILRKQLKNILVKFDAEFLRSGGVLFSHLDSVSTSVDATMAWLLWLSFNWWPSNRPRRTEVFSINERMIWTVPMRKATFVHDSIGLWALRLGSFRFLNHPASQIPDSFINPEGSGSGG